MEIIVLGGGESGVGAARLAHRKGMKVMVSDRGTIRPEYKRELEEYGIPYEEGRHSEPLIYRAREVIKSPGIPDQVPLIRNLRERGIPVIGEIEFAYRYSRAKLIGITGTNGKTTTTRLTHHLLQSGGLDADLGGNVGTSFARNLLEREAAIQVLELSSFQLDNIVDFKADIGLLLNISPDHLDRYDYRMERYVAAKFNLLRNMGPEDLFLYNSDNEWITGHLKKDSTTAQLRAINSKYIVDGRLEAGGLNFDINNPALRGQHNAMNACFAVEVARELGLGREAIQAGLDSFRNEAHRMELVASVAGVAFINDSKATNVDAAYYALEAMDSPVIWIAGGQDKGNDYAPLKPLVAQKVRALICLGKDNEVLKRAFQDQVQGPIVEVLSAAEAVQQARRLARPGDTVLLSPACASFDLFKNYQDRGDQFKAAVSAGNDK